MLFFLIIYSSKNHEKKFVVVPVFAAIILPQILHRALLASSLEKCTHTFDRLFHIFKVLCVCARVSYKYARGEFVRARASYEYVPVYGMCVSCV